MARAFELVLAPMLFAGIGYLVDRWLGTGPVVAIAFGAFGIVGVFVRSWYGYVAEMRAHEETGPWRKT